METVYKFKSPEEAAQIMKTAAETGQKLCISGRATQAKPPPGMIQLNTGMLAYLREEHPGDMLLRCGAGLPLQALKKRIGALAEKWPDYPGTVGGCFCGSIDRDAHRYLAARVLSIKIVITSGQIITLGSLAVKDVAGFKIAPLFAGSQGKLALVSELVVNISPVFRDFTPRAKIVLDSQSASLRKLYEDFIKVFDPDELLS